MNILSIKHLLPIALFNELPEIIEKYDIDTPLRLAHFLGQCSHESGHFTILRENLNYSAQGLLKIFPKYFNSTTAKQYERQPEKIANHVYANRMLNGPVITGDGWKFRGAGCIQLTGRQNFTEFDKTVEDDILTNPHLVTTKYALTSAAWFWVKNKLNSIADLGSTLEVIVKITKKINGGTHGIISRTEQFNKFYALLKD